MSAMDNIRQASAYKMVGPTNAARVKFVQSRLNNSSKEDQKDEMVDANTPNRDSMEFNSLYLASPPQFDAQSNFGPLFNFDPKKLKLAYEISETIAGRPGNTFESLSAFGFQAWESSSPLKITVELKFFKGMWGWNDARNEVFNPIALLVETVLPTEGAGGVLISPSPNYYVGLTQLLKTYTTIGSNLIKGITDFIAGGIDSLLSTSIRAQVGQAVANVTSKISSVIVGFASGRSQSRGTYNLIFGGYDKPTLQFYNYICESASPQFSLEMDESGFPIWGLVRLTFASVFSANVSHFPMHFPKI